MVDRHHGLVYLVIHVTFQTMLWFSLLVEPTTLMLYVSLSHPVLSCCTQSTLSQY